MCELLLVVNGPSRSHIYGKQSIDSPVRLAHSLVLTRTMGPYQSSAVLKIVKTLSSSIRTA